MADPTPQQLAKALTLNERMGEFGFDPSLKRGTLLPFGTNQQGENEWAVPEIGYGMMKAFVLPGHVAQGGTVTNNDVTDMALNTLGYGGFGSMGLGKAAAGGQGGKVLGANVMGDGRRFRLPDTGSPLPVVRNERRPGLGHNGPPAPTMQEVIDARAIEMGKAGKDRIQPTPGDARYLKEGMDDYERTQSMLPQGQDISLTYPRQGDPTKPMPKGGRANVFDEYHDSIAEGLAQRMRPYMDSPVRRFYHTGPLYEGALKAGLTPDEAALWMKDFGEAYAATSPRTTTDINLRNASLVMSKKAAGLDLTDILGPGTIGENAKPGINELGYPMMIGDSGIHRKLTDAVAGGGINRNTNTKPSIFGENSAGNHSGVTVDTHAIRGALDVLNERHPGAIPPEYIRKEFREAYAADPTKLDPATWIEDTVAKQSFKKVQSQVEYGNIARVYHGAANILGVSPAEAQAMGWFGSGHRTGLSSEQKTIVNLMNDRIAVTAKALGRSQDDVARAMYRRQIPLMMTGNPAMLAAGQNQDRPGPSKMALELAKRLRDQEFYAKGGI